MILDGKNLRIIPFSDSRGESGMSGKLYLAEAPDGSKYLVKSKPVDVGSSPSATSSGFFGPHGCIFGRVVSWARSSSVRIDAYTQDTTININI